MRYVTFHPGDLMVMSPRQAEELNDIDLPGDRFHLVRIIEDKGDSYDFETVDHGPCAVIEALALLTVPKGRRVWMPALGKIPREG